MHSYPLNKTYFKILFLSSVQTEKKERKQINIIKKNPKVSLR